MRVPQTGQPAAPAASRPSQTLSSFLANVSLSPSETSFTGVPASKTEPGKDAGAKAWWAKSSPEDAVLRRFAA